MVNISIRSKSSSAAVKIASGKASVDEVAVDTISVEEIVVISREFEYGPDIYIMKD